MNVEFSFHPSDMTGVERLMFIGLFLNQVPTPKDCATAQSQFHDVDVLKLERWLNKKSKWLNQIERI